MILDTLANSSRYDALSPAFARAFSWLRSVDVASLPDGKTVIDGDNVYVLVQRGLTKPLDQTKWEAHRNYADIQYIAASRETMCWEDLNKVSTGPYVAEKDFVPVETKAWTELEVSAGEYAVFFPSDAHRPSILIPGADPVVKLVIKVKV